jgi:hypothetical protein
MPKDRAIESRNSFRAEVILYQQESRSVLSVGIWLELGQTARQQHQ